MTSRRCGIESFLCAGRQDSPQPAQQAAVAAHILATLLAEDSTAATEGTQAALLAFALAVTSTLAALYKDDSSARSRELKAQLSR